MEKQMIGWEQEVDDQGTPIPEPTTFLLLSIGIVGLAGAEVRRRRKKKIIKS
ncbi:MAG: PEP-CTERM sorting domain-containing protein [Candidatus Brocadiaceae bacterium]|nr:PEP-CTERM sorting domain-containing protein [Candidatus Brocadiaceae bacterium]